MIVVDASAVVDVLLRRADADWVEGKLIVAGEAHAPSLIDVEFLSALRSLERRRAVSSARAAFALFDYDEMRLVRHPSGASLERIWALRRQVSAYDASYVALAEELGVPLVTTDRRLARSRGHRAMILAPS